MGIIYWNKKEIPIPPDAKRNAYDQQVSRYYKDAAGRRRRHVIGRAVTKTTMHPNENFRFLYPDLWQEYYQEDSNTPHELHFGLYALLLGAGHSTGIYPLLQDVCGPETGNALMDYALYSIYRRSGTTVHIQSALNEQMRFSRWPLGDSWYSDLFSHGINANAIHAFKLKWLQRCVELGVTEVWLRLEGFNSDGLMQGSTTSVPRHARSDKNANIVSYIWAVSTETGLPVTWLENTDDTNEEQAFEEIISILGFAGIKVKGVIVAPEFLSPANVELIKSFGLEYVTVLQSSGYAYSVMMARHASRIFWDLKYVLQSSRQGMFGIVDKVPLFKSSSTEDYVGLFFEGVNGTASKVQLINTVLDEAQRLQELLAVNPEAAFVEPKFSKYLRIDRSAQTPEVVFVLDEWQQDMNSKGYSAIACSFECSADELNQLYASCKASANQFSLRKALLDGGVRLVHSAAARHAQVFAVFVVSVLRNELMQASKSAKLDGNDVLHKANSMCMVVRPDLQYHASDDFSSSVLLVLGKYGITKEHFSVFANEVNTLNSKGLLSQSRKLPGSKEEPAAKDQAFGNAPAAPKRGRGRPKGSKNKKTLAREAALLAQQEQGAQESAQVEIKRGRGRPKGSKNKKTLAREAALLAQQEQGAQESAQVEIKRGRGRPKGSKNKKTLAREAALQDQHEPSAQPASTPEPN